MAFCEGLPCIPTLEPPSFYLSLHRSPRPSAPPSPPNCCLMVQLLRNTLERGLRAHGYCDGSPSRLNQQKREGHKKRTKRYNRGILFVTPEWMIVRNTSLGVCYPGCFPLNLFRVSRFSQSCLHTLVLCSFPCTDIYNSLLPLQCAPRHL